MSGLRRSDGAWLPAEDLLLAQALDACLVAEREEPGSAERAGLGAPFTRHAEVRDLVALAAAIQAIAPTVVAPPDFRQAARERLMRHAAGHLAGVPPARARLTLVSVPAWSRARRGLATWAVRVAAGLVAVSLASVATLNAAASALPGDTLYSVKELGETLAERLAPTDDARSLTLLQQADARLDETARLLEQGRVTEATETSLRYERAVEKATSALNSQGDGLPSVIESTVFQTTLSEHEARLEQALRGAPESARPGLEGALAASSRGRAQAADAHEERSDPNPTAVAPRREPEAETGRESDRPIPGFAPAVPSPSLSEPTRLPERQPDDEGGDETRGRGGQGASRPAASATPRAEKGEDRDDRSPAESTIEARDGDEPAPPPVRTPAPTPTRERSQDAPRADRGRRENTPTPL